jgi:hypothetical protein
VRNLAFPAQRISPHAAGILGAGHERQIQSGRGVSALASAPAGEVKGQFCGSVSAKLPAERVALDRFNYAKLEEKSPSKGRAFLPNGE